MEEHITGELNEYTDEHRNEDIFIKDKKKSRAYIYHSINNYFIK